MDRHPFQIFCKVCGKPVDLQTDLSADEYGKSVHEQCYVKKLRGPVSILPGAWPLTTLKPYHYGNGLPTLRRAG